MEKIIRHQWRGTLRSDLPADVLNAAIQNVQQLGQSAKDEGKIIALCLYQWHDMLFVYTESLQPLSDTYELLSPLFPLLKEWPEFNGPRALADMFPIYWHSVPKEQDAWLKERTA